MADHIHFYRAGEQPFGAFSNFSRHPIRIDGRVWPTSEHYFQAQKFPNTAHAEAIRLTDEPGQAAHLGRSRALPLRPDWEQVKEDVMRRALRHKFTQHADLGRLLRSTDDAVLVEHTANDRYWADGGDGRGKNRLGALLMEVRTELERAELFWQCWSGQLRPSKEWVLFLRGTLVVLPKLAPGADRTAMAVELLAQHGPVVVGTPAGDFSVTALGDQVGWVVSSHHPAILNLVLPDEGNDAGDLVIGLLGRTRRHEDATDPVVYRVHQPQFPGR